MVRVFKGNFGKNRIRYMALSEVVRMLPTSKDDKTHGGKR